MYEQLSKYALRVFSFFWMFIVFLDYWYYHQGATYPSIKHFQYLDLVSVLVLVGVGSYLMLHKFSSIEKPFLLANGLGVLLLFVLISTIILLMHIPKLELPFTITSSDAFILLGKTLIVLGITYLIVTCCYVMGNFVFEQLFSVQLSKLESTILQIALGILCLNIILFILGSLNLLKPIVIAPLLIGSLLLFRKATWAFFKYTLLQPIQVKDKLNWIGFGSLMVILTFISLTFLQNNRPFPYGFDALAIYLNLPKLISEQNGLITGFSPYYWSLFVSLGFILFDSLPIVISLSVLGGILSGFTIYAICYKWLDRNYSLLTVALFFSLPLVNHQSYRDVKTDLGLLFFMLVVVLVLLNYLLFIYPEKLKPQQIVKRVRNKRSKKVASKKTVKPAVVQEETYSWLSTKISKEKEYLLLLGLLSGMVLGIKLTGLILIFSIIGIFTYIKTGTVGFLSSVTLFLFIILMGGLDIASGLRPYHFSASIFMWATLLIGTIGLGYLWMQQRKPLLEVVKNIMLYVAMVVVIYLPWPIKNFAETGQISISTLIEGKTTGVSKNIFKYLENAKNNTSNK